MKSRLHCWPVGAVCRKRRGFTLVEVGVAITLAAFVMGGATALLIGMIRTNGAARQRLEQITVRSNLARIFREDVGNAKFCVLLDEKKPGAGVVLHLDDKHSVRYVAGENDLQRIAQTGDEVTAREVFYLGERQQARLAMTTDTLRLVRCTIEPSTPLAEPEKRLAGAKARPALIVVAVLGRSIRLAEAVRKAVPQPKVVPPPRPEPDEDADSSKEIPSP
ncbi:MAG TPA: type II secretion system protein [Pirellulales bacterium]|jgi:type II secretory pathway pseudopilin PulG|nr:type II secretion system protein [Pirellulales bacterium]